jgi:biopolymer transport protein ExbB
MSTKCRAAALVLLVALIASSVAYAATFNIVAQGQERFSGGALGKTVNYLILGLQGLMSIVLMGLIIWYFLSLSVTTIIPPSIVEQMDAMLKKGSYDELMDFCRTTPTYLTNIVAAGLERARAGEEYEQISKSLQESGDEESIKLEQRVSWLSLVGTIAPMLGLLGTVVGMLIAFDVIAQTTNPQPSDLAVGIRGALWTTVVGLVIAIPAMSFFFFFRNRASALSIELNTCCETLFARFRRTESVEKKP